LFSSNDSTRENNSSIEGGGAFLAAAAWTDSGGVGHAFQDIAQADLLVANESRQPNAKRFVF
jgi:hypothetical protein